MNAGEVICVRRSIRKYKSDQAAEGKLERVPEVSRLSPSAANKQPWHFISVTDPSTKEAQELLTNRAGSSTYPS